ncbi:glycosyltransferase family 4 protein [Neosynechococcus sphagnicola]|nr:glycosyltransferase family 4 protein [Neosynechococcus sphagnicola]
MKRFLTPIKSRLPPWLRRLLAGGYYYGHHAGQWLRLWLDGRSASTAPVVFYGKEIPASGAIAHGGVIKFQRMQAQFPNTSRRFNLLYLVSSSLPEDARQLLWLARQKGAKFLWNQNGVAYPGWHGPGWEATNRPLATLLQAADHVFYQSQFCQRCADQFLGNPTGTWEILYNAVDTQVFTPAPTDPDPQHLVLLLGGTQYQFYRLATALNTLAVLTQSRRDVKLLVTGALCWTTAAIAQRMAEELIQQLQLGDRVTFLGAYSQQQAPEMLRQAHILLHTKYNDPCPGLVIEAMACGLPVVYSHSGGVPELVGDSAGTGIAAPLSWDQDLPPDPQAMARAVLQVAERRQEYATAARQRAIECFDLRPWLDRHRQVFQELLTR